MTQNPLKKYFETEDKVTATQVNRSKEGSPNQQCTSNKDTTQEKEID